VTRSILVASVVVLLAVVLVIGSRWRDATNRDAVEPDAAAADSQEAGSVARTTPPSPQEALPPAVEPTTTLASEITGDSPDEDLSAVIAGIDPLLRERNVIVRAPDPKQTGPGFVGLESRFGTESADPSWSPGTEARILEQVAHVDGLKLVSLEAQCRATICRLKLFHPAGTNALSPLGKLVPMATAIGFSHVVQVATLDQNGVAISLLYFQRGQDPTPR
jgi:hypothetical protein